MQYIRFGLLILSLAASFGFGFLIPLRYGSDRYGFIQGMLVGSPITVLGAVMVGYLVAGLGEGMLGTTAGVPVGLFMGCFTGLAGLNFLWGVCGHAPMRVNRTGERDSK